MNPTSVDLSLSLKPPYVPQTISNFLADVPKIDDESDKLSVLSAYICMHQEELRRVEALRHELPQCRLLLMEAIERLKEEFMKIKQNMGPQPPVEYLPIKRKTRNELEKRVNWEKYSTKEAYWNPSYAKKQETAVLDSFQPCKDRNMEGFLLPYKESLESSSAGKGKEIATNQLSRHQGPLYLNYRPKPLTQPIWKNNRIHWSSELHARFVEALNLLGGIEVAIPRRIRDLMQVEGLTIDHVQSHLQDFWKEACGGRVKTRTGTFELGTKHPKPTLSEGSCSGPNRGNSPPSQEVEISQLKSQMDTIQGLLATIIARLPPPSDDPSST